MRPGAADILEGGRAVRIVWPDGCSARFHALWLRDSALDPKTRSAGNGQRLITILDIPDETLLTSASFAASGDVHFAFAPDGHETVFSAAWLRDHIYDRALRDERGWVSDDLELWDGGLGVAGLTAAYDAVKANPTELHDWLAAVRRYGFAILTGVPRVSGSLLDVAGLFGFVRETNYGRWFEVRAEVNPTNLAYTNLGLQAHTDNPYRDPVPTLQLLCCLENSVRGGESVVIDGFRVAQRLREENPRGFNLLCRYPVRFEYAGSSGVRLRAKRPFIELGPDGEMIAIRFNNRSTAALVDVPFDDLPDFYAAYRRFSEILEEPGMEVTFRLAPGELFIVDNTRVLHARKAFFESGTRWLQGCYADKDGLLSWLSAADHAGPKGAAS